jgi:hypothetical protein
VTEPRPDLLVADAIAAGHDLLAQMIGAHQAGRFRADDPHALQFALTQIKAAPDRPAHSPCIDRSKP